MIIRDSSRESKIDFILCVNINYCMCLYSKQASPESVFVQALQNHLLPGHTYSHVSGGRPLDILDLTVSVCKIKLLIVCYQLLE